MVLTRLQDILDMLRLSLTEQEIGEWSIASNPLLDGATPLTCLSRRQYEWVYQAALAI